jgi:LPS-assembly lipoprotein
MTPRREGGGLFRLVRMLPQWALILALAGCLQPLYGERPVVGGHGVRESLAAVKVAPIDAPFGTPLARLAVETRNHLIFDLTGGAAPNAPTHELVVRLSASRTSVIVDLNSLRPDIEIAAVEASYTLTELATGKSVVTGTASARVSYDIPGGEQRFARARGLRDAESRAVRQISETIRNRLASYFVAGT